MEIFPITIAWLIQRESFTDDKDSLISFIIYIYVKISDGNK